MAVLLTACNVVFSQGIEFFHGTFDQACEKAKKESKNIFVDVYTSWCGPCKMMARDVFTQKSVGDYFNKNFVCMKLDAEKNKDSKFFTNYKATAFPSFFWLSADGKLLDMKTGGRSPEQFIKEAKIAVTHKLGEKAIALEKRWNSGEKTPEMLSEYVFNILTVTNPKAVKPTVIEYLKGLSEEELRSRESLQILKKFFRRSSDEDYIYKTFMSNIEFYVKYESTSSCSLTSMWKHMYNRFVRGPGGILIKANKLAKVNKDNSELMDEYKAEVKKVKNVDFKYKDMFVDCIEAEKLLYLGDYSKGISEMEKVFAKYGNDYPFLYGQLLYSLSYSEYFIKGMAVNGDKVLTFAKTFLQKVPNQQSITYYSIACTNMGMHKEAVSAMAWLPYYPKPGTSNAYFKNFGFNNIRAKFPYANNNNKNNHAVKPRRRR